MSETDYSSLDGRLLQVFLSVYDSESVSEAARRLDVNQSTISHSLTRLRKILGDELFVRSGRGIAPTERAHVVADQARSLLVEMKRFTDPVDYEPQNDEGSFTIAAGEFEIDAALSTLFHELRRQAPHLTLRIVRPASQADVIQLLRDDDVDLALAPTLDSSESDLFQNVLFDDHDLCFYDEAVVNAPATLDDYCAAPHAIVVTGDFRRTEIDAGLAEFRRSRHIVLEAPSFGALAEMIRGTNTIATLPSLLQQSSFFGFGSIEPPLPLAPFTISQIWHRRNAKSQRHRWMRDLIKEIADTMA